MIYVETLKLKPNIVIISLDAVRAQNSSFYGYSRNTTPFLSSMERELAIYENAISSTYCGGPYPLLLRFLPVCTLRDRAL